MVRKKLGEALIERRLITSEQLADALTFQIRHPMRLGAALVARGYISERQLVEVLGSLLEVTVVTTAQLTPEPAALKLVDPHFAADHDLVPLKVRRERNHQVLTVAMADPLNFRVIDELGFITNADIEPVLGSLSDIDSAIRRAYGQRLGGGPKSHGRGVSLITQEEGPEMTILRPGGDEEKVNTQTGPIRSPFIAPLQSSPSPAVAPRAPDPLQSQPVILAPIESVLLLTEEVSGSTKVTADALPEGSSAAPIPLTTLKGRTPSRLSFDASLGALIDAAGEAVTAEAFLELERKFWALMRIMSRKGLVTADEFLAEIRVDQDKK